ncbi:HesA/MoeB/ThiF family protein [Labilibacter marinus]|uniref:HesA/MoeB/ThiF family protein n=1 Tax=Labilibacter marinus TaxID=1477105 RepID=UPI00094FA874|nr:HesA/MoeB/ThiF family protein [Labilibacter marinus]
MLSKQEESRYQRQLILPDFGESAQLKLKNSTVFVAGAGGLGGPVCFYLAAAGIGKLIICDRDTVDLSNLNRQILHGTAEIDVPKADSANKTLSNLNTEIVIETHNTSINDDNIEQLASMADIIVDCLDNIATRNVLNRFSIKNKIPVMHAGIDGWNAQLTLLNPPLTACMSCLFDEAIDTDEPKPVLGAVAGAVGTLQALETIKYLTAKSSVENTLLFFDALGLEYHKLPIEKNENCSACSHL